MPLLQYRLLLIVADTLHDNPNNQAPRSERLRGNHNMSNVQLLRSKIPRCASTVQSGINIVFPPMEKEFAFDYHQKHHTQATSLLFSLQGYWFSRLRVLGRHHTDAPDLKDVFPFSVHRERPIFYGGKSPPQVTIWELYTLIMQNKYWLSISF